MARVFAQEDGNLSVKPITTSRVKVYKDIDLSFTARSNKDIFKKEDASSVKQGVKNLLLTNRGEKPFDYYYGGNLNDYLFENFDELDEEEVSDMVSSAMSNYEPRAIFRGLRLFHMPDNNTIQLTVQFQIKNTYENTELNIELTRLR